MQKKLQASSSQSKDVEGMKKTIIELESLLKRSEAARKAMQADYHKQVSELQDLKRIADELNRSPLTTAFTPYRKSYAPPRNNEPSEDEFTYSPTNDQLAVENKILHQIVTMVKEDLRLAAAEDTSIILE